MRQEEEGKEEGGNTPMPGQNQKKQTLKDFVVLWGSGMRRITGFGRIRVYLASQGEHNNGSRWMGEKCLHVRFQWFLQEMWLCKANQGRPRIQASGRLHQAPSSQTSDSERLCQGLLSMILCHFYLQSKGRTYDTYLPTGNSDLFLARLRHSPTIGSTTPHVLPETPVVLRIRITVSE